MELTQEIVKSLFIYRDGVLYYIDKPSNFIKAGSIAGSINKESKRREIKVFGKTKKAARLIFLYHHGWLPVIVDHIDRDVQNDKIDNLRASDRATNPKNRNSAKGSSSKYLGVHYMKDQIKWMASIRVKTVPIYLGVFIKEGDAALAYNRGAVMYHGEFANLNIIKP